MFTEQVDVGSIVMPGNEIARIYASDIFEIVVPLSDLEAGLIPGLWETERTHAPRAVVTLPYRGHVYAWDGYVDRVEAGVDPDTRTIDVVVRVPDPTKPGRLLDAIDRPPLVDPPPLLAGTYAGVEIEGLTLAYALIPRAALRNDSTVWLVNGDETLRVVPVDVVQDQGSEVAIRSDVLTSGDRLVISDLAFVSEGLHVRVTSNEGEGP